MASCVCVVRRCMRSLSSDQSHTIVSAAYGCHLFTLVLTNSTVYTPELLIFSQLHHTSVVLRDAEGSGADAGQINECARWNGKWRKVIASSFSFRFPVDVGIYLLCHSVLHFTPFCSMAYYIMLLIQLTASLIPSRARDPATIWQKLLAEN